MATAKLQNPSVLAFEAKLVPSDALLFAGKWEERNDPSAWQPIQVHEKSVRGTISNRLKAAVASDPAKLDAEVSKPNLQTVDTAALPFDSDSLRVSFTLRVLGNLDRPSTCNNPEYQQVLSQVIQNFAAEHGFKNLAKRYAANIANGRFLWRNRVGAEAVEVQVRSGEKNWTFNAFDLSLRDFDYTSPQLEELASLIESGLKEADYAFVEVHAYVKLGSGQAVFPSQELVMGGGKGNKSKFLYQLNGQAAMHSQKIGNALRTIDTWHSAVGEVGPIAVEPYGSVTNRGAAYRQPKQKTDFYNLLDRWMLKSEPPAVEQQHYVMAMLVRGGVFGE